MMHMPLSTLLSVALAFLVVDSVYAQPTGQGRPNVVIIYADDLGYGDLSCYNPASRVKTLHIDKMAHNGLRFIRAYAAGATCTPSRYSLMTGEYAWRKQGTGVLPGDASAIIRKGRQTLGTVFQAAGYQTGVVGKWHLGLGDETETDWNKPISQTPNDIGFHYAFIMAATGDRVPTVYVENSRVVGLDAADPLRISYQAKVGNEPTGRDNPEQLTMGLTHGHDNTIVNGISRIGFMAGGKRARWVDEHMADDFTGKAIQFIEANRSRPFMLYFAPHDIHVPRVPHPRFVGKSGMGPRGDAILELDWSVGEVMRVLDQLGLASRTLVILSSDNGPVLDDGYADEAVEKLGSHKPAGPLRGGKYSILEAGTRVPFIVQYPNQVKVGVSEALISQVDLLASLAALLHRPIQSAQAPDSQNRWDALRGADPKGRTEAVIHSQVGDLFGLVTRRWKYMAPSEMNPFKQDTRTEMGTDRLPQLYDLQADPVERINKARQNPQVTRQLVSQLARIRRGR